MGHQRARCVSEITEGTSLKDRVLHNTDGTRILAVYNILNPQKLQRITLPE
jgi:hypothetical protein